MATNFLRLFKAGSARLVLVVGVFGVDCAAGVGSMYTWSAEGAISSGLFLGWAVASGSKSMGFG